MDAFIRYRSPAHLGARNVAIYLDAEGFFEVAEDVRRDRRLSGPRRIDAQEAADALSVRGLARVLEELGL